jgi:hypothetical protein
MAETGFWLSFNTAKLIEFPSTSRVPSSRGFITLPTPGCGTIFATIHNVQSDVPPENLMAVWETLTEFGSY